MGWPIGWESLEPLHSSEFHFWLAKMKDGTWWDVEPDIPRVATGMPHRVDRLKALGNGQVPLCAATAYNLLKGRRRQ